MSNNKPSVVLILSVGLNLVLLLLLLPKWVNIYEPPIDYSDSVSPSVEEFLQRVDQQTEPVLTLSEEEQQQYQNALGFLKEAKRSIDAGPIGTFQLLFNREKMQSYLQELAEIERPTREITKLQRVLFNFNQTYHSNGLKKEEYDLIIHNVVVIEDEKGMEVPAENLEDVARKRGTTVDNIKKFNPTTTDVEDNDIYLSRDGTATLILYIKRE